MNHKKQKVLIIKVGYSETLDPEISNITSYGDVLRTTVLLNLYKKDHVTWLVDSKAYPILKGNQYIDRILIYDMTSVLQLESEHFDTVINLEKVPGLCALSDKITAWRRYGFRFDVKKGEAEAYDGTQNALSVCQNEKKKKNHNKFWQEHLFEMVGEKWKGEEYILGYEPKSKEVYDIGFNFLVGNKWPTKAWPSKNWSKLETLLDKEYSVSLQKGIDNMEKYFEWINSCKAIITNDSFGLHIALALKKKVIAIFGPTNSNETYLYERGISATASKKLCKDIPCNSPVCKNSDGCCLSKIKAEDIYFKINIFLKQEFKKLKIA